MSMLERIAAACPGLTVRSNRNRQTLVSLRAGRRGLKLSVHQQLLDDPQLTEELIRFARQQGRGTYPLLRQAMNRVFADLQAQRQPAAPDPAIAALPGHDGYPAVGLRLRMLCERYWPDLSPVALKWGRDPGMRALKSIRFGSYRSRPQSLITLHPRLLLPWVPQVFVDFIIYHELCHHAQYCQPLRGETSHSSRFKAWERRFAQYGLAIAWEKAYLSTLLDPFDYYDQYLQQPR